MTQRCPWEYGDPDGFDPEDPCPVCGALGTWSATGDLDPDNVCVSDVPKVNSVVLQGSSLVLNPESETDDDQVWDQLNKDRV